jgi:hypothetical protein
MNDVDRRLLELVRGRAGDALRGVVRYDEDGYTALYVREDVQTDELREVFPSLVARMRSDEPVVPSEVYGAFGATQATVELHENAALVHFSREETGGRGLLVSLDRDVAQGLGTFVDDCMAVFDGG